MIMRMGANTVANAAAVVALCCVACSVAGLAGGTRDSPRRAAVGGCRPPYSVCAFLRFSCRAAGQNDLPVGCASAGRALRLRGGRAGEQPPASQVASAEPLSGAELEAFGNVMKRRFFFAPSFHIHGGFAGLFDYGPTGCAVKKSLIAAWREHFVVQEGMLEIDCPTVTPEPVLAASGHVQRFTDLMVRDESSGDCFRADKLVEEACSAARARLANPVMRANELKKAAATGAAAQSGASRPPAVAAVVASAAAGDHDAHRTALEQLQNAAGTFDAAGVEAALRALNVSSPTTGAPLSAPFPFNLMFRTSIGPTGTQAGFMRPETAQVNDPLCVSSQGEAHSCTRAHASCHTRADRRRAWVGGEGGEAGGWGEGGAGHSLFRTMHLNP